ncbi:hypothetical protein Bpfe_011579, partial [Biomphalaria pfeifferi]
WSSPRYGSKPNTSCHHDGSKSDTVTLSTLLTSPVDIGNKGKLLQCGDKVVNLSLAKSIPKNRTDGAPHGPD